MEESLDLSFDRLRIMMMMKVHVSFCSCYTIRILISKTLSGTYEGGYTYVLEMCCYRMVDIVIYTYIYCC